MCLYISQTAATARHTFVSSENHAFHMLHSFMTVPSHWQVTLASVKLSHAPETHCCSTPQRSIAIGL